MVILPQISHRAIDCTNLLLKRMPNANTDDGSCVVFGCMDESASNFNSIATNEDDSCLYPGCTDPNYLEYDENANTDDGSCSCVSSVEIGVTTTSEEPFEAVVSVVGDYNLYSSGVTSEDLMAMHYSSATQELHACLLYGDVNFCDYAAEELSYSGINNITSEDLMAMSYTEELYYCLMAGVYCDEAADQLYSSGIGTPNFVWSNDEGVLSTSEEFILSTPGEYTFSLALNGCETLNQNFVVISGEVVSGCTNSTAINYNEEANSDDGSCIIEGCTDSIALNYNPSANQNDNLCQYILGCTDSTAYNFDAVATQDDGSCVSIIFGCTDTAAFNFDSQANTDDGSCLPKIFGCTDQSASNFNSNANTDDGLCIPYVQLPEGWSMFGYTCLEPLDVVDAFSDISASIEIVKDEWGLAYLPSWGFSAFDNLEFGEGYQIKMIENVTGFEFCGTNWLEDGVSQADLDVAVDAAVEQVEISYADHTPPLDLQIGDYYAGGIVFQINENGSGLVAATNDHGPYTWKQATTIASQYIAEGYSGWHIPSIEELELMYNTIGQGGDNSGGFENTTYWSSSPFEGGSGWSYSGYGADLDFSTGTIYGSQMLPWFNNYGQQYAYEASLKVRLVRAF